MTLELSKASKNGFTPITKAPIANATNPSGVSKPAAPAANPAKLSLAIAAVAAVLMPSKVIWVLPSATAAVHACVTAVATTVLAAVAAVAIPVKVISLAKNAFAVAAAPVTVAIVPVAIVFAANANWSDLKAAIVGVVTVNSPVTTALTPTKLAPNPTMIAIKLCASDGMA